MTADGTNAAEEHMAPHEEDVRPKLKKPLKKPTLSTEPKRVRTEAPKFLLLLYEILENEDDQVIRWAADGLSLQILDPAIVTDKILPKYFNHTNFHSFQRQLNYFGFRKWTKSKTDICTFSHPYFRQNQPELLQLIKRKKASRKNTTTNASSSSNEPTTSTNEPVLIAPQQLQHQQQQQQHRQSMDESQPESEPNAVAMLGRRLLPLSPNGKRKLELTSDANTSNNNTIPSLNLMNHNGNSAFGCFIAPFPASSSSSASTSSSSSSASSSAVATPLSMGSHPMVNFHVSHEATGTTTTTPMMANASLFHQLHQFPSQFSATVQASYKDNVKTNAISPVAAGGVKKKAKKAGDKKSSSTTTNSSVSTSFQYGLPATYLSTEPLQHSQPELVPVAVSEFAKTSAFGTTTTTASQSSVDGNGALPTLEIVRNRITSNGHDSATSFSMTSAATYMNATTTSTMAPSFAGKRPERINTSMPMMVSNGNTGELSPAFSNPVDILLRIKKSQASSCTTPNASSYPDTSMHQHHGHTNTNTSANTTNMYATQPPPSATSTTTTAAPAPTPMMMMSDEQKEHMTSLHNFILGHSLYTNRLESQLKVLSEENDQLKRLLDAKARDYDTIANERKKLQHENAVLQDDKNKLFDINRELLAKLFPQ